MPTVTKTLSLNAYQAAAKTTALYPEVKGDLVYPTLGLAGEAGEVANKVKKIFRDDGGVLSDERRDMIIKELGDVLWYTAHIATILDTTLEEVAQRNLATLQARKQTNLLRGDGDNRELA